MKEDQLRRTPDVWERAPNPKRYSFKLNVKNWMENDNRVNIKKITPNKSSNSGKTHPTENKPSCSENIPKIVPFGPHYL